MKVGSSGLLFSSAALREIKGDCNLRLEGLGSPLSFYSRLQPPRKDRVPLGPVGRKEVSAVATEASAKEKFIRSVTSDLAVTKMTTKLSNYLGISVSSSSAPVRSWKDLMSKAASELFDKCYDNMKSAYK